MFAHFQAKHLEPRFPCPACEQTFNRHASRANHYYKCHVSSDTGLVGAQTLKNPVNVSSDTGLKVQHKVRVSEEIRHVNKLGLASYYED